jgi:hypothetical protein
VAGAYWLSGSRCECHSRQSSGVARTNSCDQSDLVGIDMYSNENQKAHSADTDSDLTSRAINLISISLDIIHPVQDEDSFFTQESRQRSKIRRPCRLLRSAVYACMKSKTALRTGDQLHRPS